MKKILETLIFAFVGVCLLSLERFAAFLIRSGFNPRDVSPVSGTLPESPQWISWLPVLEEHPWLFQLDCLKADFVEQNIKGALVQPDYVVLRFGEDLTVRKLEILIQEMEIKFLPGSTLTMQSETQLCICGRLKG